MRTAQQLFEEANAKYQQAKALLTKDNVTAEELETADNIRQDADQIKSRAKRLLELDEASATPIPQAAPKQDTAPTEFKDWDEYVAAVMDGLMGRKIDPRLKMAEKTMSGSTGAAGGVLIPTAQLAEIWAAREFDNVLVSRVQRIPMAERTLKIPALDQTGTTAGENHFFGGINVYVSEEGADVDDSDAALSSIELVAREVTGGTYVTNSLIKDVPALAAYLRAVFPRAMMAKKEYLFLRGNGAGQALGILNAPVLKTVTRTTGGSIEFLDLVNMESGYMGGESGIWVGSIGAKAKLLAMSGPSGNASYLWGSAKDGVPRTLMGRPIQWSDKLPAAGTKGDLMLVDPDYYVHGALEEGAVLESDASPRFMKNQTAFRIVERYDGQPWLRKVITVYDGSTTISPFLAIS